MIAESIIKPLTHLCNLSMTNNYVPYSWKIAKILPAHKNGPKDDVGNYRPLGLTTVFSKILERCVAKQMTKYMKQHKIWYPMQFGFRENHKCESLLLKYNDILFKAKQNKMHTVAVMVDCRKAFDVIRHDILIEKLKFYGLPYSWIDSFLKGRSQFVQIGSRKSTICETGPLGIGQGTVIGPLCYAIYCMEVFNSTRLKCLMFADDTSYLGSSKNFDKLFEIVNEELSKLEGWYAANGLLLHPAKTRFILYSPRKKCPDLFLGGEKIIRVGEEQTEKKFKLLGVELDSQCTYKYHIDKLRRKVQAAASLIKRSKNSLPYRMKLMLYNALVVSNLNYCSNIWGGSTSQLGRLEVAQKRCIRIITDSKYNQHTTPLFHKTKTLALKHIIELNNLKLANRVILDLEPEVIRTIFPRQQVRKTRSGDKPLLVVPKVSTMMERRLPQFTVPYSWKVATMKYGINLLTSTDTLSRNYKKRMNEIYSRYRCDLGKCYPCGKH